MTDGTVMVSVGRHQLAATVFGEGAPAVVIEPSFGGAAEDWEKIAQAAGRGDDGHHLRPGALRREQRRPGRADAARHRRRPGRPAAGARVTGPVVLVGHSAGGIYVRAYAAAHLDRVAGMVLVESSHEGQRPVLDPLRSRAGPGWTPPS